MRFDAKGLTRTKSGSLTAAGPARLAICSSSSAGVSGCFAFLAPPLHYQLPSASQPLDGTKDHHVFKLLSIETTCMRKQKLSRF